MSLNPKSNEKNLSCEICFRSFKKLEHLKRHARSHAGTKAFNCKFPNCHKSFSRSDNLLQHTRTHIQRGYRTKNVPLPFIDQQLTELGVLAFDKEKIIDETCSRTLKKTEKRILNPTCPDFQFSIVEFQVYPKNEKIETTPIAPLGVQSSAMGIESLSFYSSFPPKRFRVDENYLNLFKPL